jgi:cobalt-zinc-cadmium efflux system membrane fusion protein
MRGRSHIAFFRSLAVLCLALLPAACDSANDKGVDSKVQQKRTTASETVQLEAEELARAEIVVEPATRGEFRDYNEFPGMVIPNRRALAEVTALVRGRVQEVYADLGQEVQKGTLLALLHSKDLGMAQSAYLSARARLYVTKRAHERAQSLLKTKVIGLAEALRREGEVRRARAEVRESHDRLLLLGMKPSEIRQIEKEQKIRSQFPIVAPFAARVIARDVTRGEVVEVTERLFVVADLSHVWVQVNVPEKDVALIPQEGSPEAERVEVRVTAYPKAVFYGRITYSSDVLDPTTRTVPLRLELPNRDGRLKPQMFARIRIYMRPERQALVVRESAVQRDRDRQFVFVQQGEGSFERRDVRVGASNGRLVKVLEGLKEGEAVVVKGAFILKSELLGEQT